MEVWDFYYKQNEIAYTVKVSDFPLTSITLNSNMAAIGDAEGTISIMNLCKPLYDTTIKEKEVMQSIFDREYRREKQLENQRRLESQAKAPAKKAVDPEKAKREKEEKMTSKLEEQREFFFKTVSEGEDLDAIRARGEAFDRQPDESKQFNSSINIEKVNLEEGKNYTFLIEGKPYPFVVEAGGIVAGASINGQI
jgi:dynein intermediate chain 2